MENVIEKIIEIDNKACERLDHAEAQKSQIIEKAKLDAESIRKNLFEQTDLKILEIKKSFQSESDIKIKEILKEKDLMLKTMYESYKQQHESIEHSIFSRIVGE